MEQRRKSDIVVIRGDRSLTQRDFCISNQAREADSPPPIAAGLERVVIGELLGAELIDPIDFSRSECLACEFGLSRKVSRTRYFERGYHQTGSMPATDLPVCVDARERLRALTRNLEHVELCARVARDAHVVTSKRQRAKLNTDVQGIFRVGDLRRRGSRYQYQEQRDRRYFSIHAIIFVESWRSDSG